MIRVQIEAITYHGRQSIAEIQIVNDLSHDNRPKMGNYNVTATGDFPTMQTTVKNHNREHGAATLVRMALKRLGSFNDGYQLAQLITDVRE